MKTTSYDVDFPYSESELASLMAEARKRDVESGGRYDTGSAAIHVWTHTWMTELVKEESTLIGSFFLAWAGRRNIWKILCEEGFSLDDLLHELALLEEASLGTAKHGRRRT